MHTSTDHMTRSDDLASLRDYWGVYHNHKEQMAFAGTTVYLAAATAMVMHPTWPKGPPHWLMLKLMIASIVIAFAFVAWQLRNRETAAGIVSACNHILWDDRPPRDTDDPGGANTWRG